MMVSINSTAAIYEAERWWNTQHECPDTHGDGRKQRLPRMQQPPKEDGVTYLCVTDVQITDRRMGKPLGQPVANQQASTGPKVQQMRMVDHVRQIDLDIPEATPIISFKRRLPLASRACFSVAFSNFSVQGGPHRPSSRRPLDSRE